jgi:hypothetical protein
VSSKPEMDRTRSHSAEELKEHGLERIREAVALIELKATAEELEDYRRFVVSLSERVAGAKSEGDGTASEAETAAIAAVTSALRGE